MKWLREMQAPQGRSSHQLLACPHAGGWSSSFVSWQRNVPAAVQFLVAQLPGREKRAAEKNATSLREVVAGVVDELPDSPAPLTVLGHSFGAVVAYEIVRSLRASGRPVRLLAVSGRQPPCFPSEAPFASDASCEDLLARLVDMGGVSSSLRDRPTLMEPFIEAIRGDLRLMEQYQRPPSPCDVPITAIHARQDPVVMGDRMRLWGVETTALFSYIEVEGDHFGILQEPQTRELLKRLGLSSR